MLHGIFFKRHLFNLAQSVSSHKGLAFSAAMDVQHKCLAVLDFDCTLINDTCDYVVRKLLPKNKIIPYQNEGWIVYMRNIYQLLNANGIKENTIKNAICQIKPVSGMYELLQKLTENTHFDVVIISDSNSYFIKTWLEHYKLNNFTKIISNIARFNNGELNVEMYKLQNTCGLSEISLCKGDALENFIKDQKLLGINYKHVVYAGDGFNDFCPILRLRNEDLACCRQGFECADTVINVQKGEKVRDKMYNIQAKTLFWESGFDILTAIKDITCSNNVDVKN